jgi:hypothetical protein
MHYLVILRNTQHAKEILGWFRVSYYKYVYKYPERCNDNIFVLLQDLCMYRVPAVPIIMSSVMQLTVTGTTYIALDHEVCGNVHFNP